MLMISAESERAGARVDVAIKLPICYRGYQKARRCNFSENKDETSAAAGT